MLFKVSSFMTIKSDAFFNTTRLKVFQKSSCNFYWFKLQLIELQGCHSLSQKILLEWLEISLSFPDFFFQIFNFFLVLAQITNTSCSFLVFNNKRKVVCVCFCVRCLLNLWKKDSFQKFNVNRLKQIQIKKQN